MNRLRLYRCLTAALPLLTLSGVARAQANGDRDRPAPETSSQHDHANDDVAPPVRVRDVQAVYPTSELTSGKDVLVVLAVTVDASGHVSKVDVLDSGGAVFDEAAAVAARLWLFQPGTRGGKPLPTRIRVPIHFAPPLAPEVTPKESPSPDAPKAHEEDVVNVHARAPHLSRGASDYDLHVGELARVPRKNAAALLTLAPGIYLQNEGGEGHAEQVFLRGFDAREGQDIEFSVNGVPINETGNLHANGYADTHFIIPELVSSLRVVEGPFDPRQGNYAVAGSADYELGLQQRGITAKTTYGSFNTQRMLLTWGPANTSEHTFGGGELYKTDGFGANRDAQRGSAMAQYEGKLGDKGSFRVLGQAYASSYHSAGLLRQDDVDSGKKGFFSTYDTNQGGQSSRYSISGDIEQKVSTGTIGEQVFLISRGMRVKENFTGYLLDVQEPVQQPHAQRGDLIDRDISSLTVGNRGWYRQRMTAYGLPQDVEVGYFARYDNSDGTQFRNSADTQAPYKRDIDLNAKVADVGMYADSSLRPLKWLTFRGGARGEILSFDVLNRCAVKSIRSPDASNPPGDASCLSQSDFGKYREPTQRVTTAGGAFLPRASVILGPYEHFSLSASYGKGIRSIDPIYVSQDSPAPFASVDAYEGGLSYAHSTEARALLVKSVFFQTHVDKDLVFSETEGRNTLANGTTRTGWAGSARFAGSFFDTAANFTLVRSTFDDTHLLVPYVPDVVVRSDNSLHSDLPLSALGSGFHGAIGAGASLVGPRALPYGQRSDTIFTVDASVQLDWKQFQLGLMSTNLTDAQYKSGEFNYASDFRSQSRPTLVPVRHFAAGAPRQIFLTFAINLGGTP